MDGWNPALNLCSFNILDVITVMRCMRRNSPKGFISTLNISNYDKGLLNRPHQWNAPLSDKRAPQARPSDLKSAA